MEGSPPPSPSSPGKARLEDFLHGLVAHRNQVCHENAITIDHKHCIGCVLVMRHMQDNHPGMEYGTEAQWIEESAFCAMHEVDLMRDFIERNRDGLVR
jgi:hypothetical protein